jgi:hypothetical protein
VTLTTVALIGATMFRWSRDESEGDWSRNHLCYTVCVLLIPVCTVADIVIAACRQH